MTVAGPSGAGKSTLISALTLDAPYGKSTGSVTLNGVPMTEAMFRQHCYVMKQHDIHWPYLTCRETLLHAAQLYDIPAGEVETRVDYIIRKMGLEICADTRNASLSGGQRRRLSIGLALLKQPTVLFLGACAIRLCFLFFAFYQSGTCSQCKFTRLSCLFVNFSIRMIMLVVHIDGTLCDVPSSVQLYYVTRCTSVTHNIHRVVSLAQPEPTTGLDAAASTNIMQEIVRVAKEERLIIICTIHQPSTRVFNSFDQLMILSRGRAAFVGNMEDAVPYFSDIGYTCPPAMNPAEVS